MAIGEDPRPVRPSTLTNDDRIKRVRAVISVNRRLTVREVADELGIAIASCLQIFTQKPMRRVSAKFVQRLSTDDPQLSGKTSDIRCAPSITLFFGLCRSRLFPVSQT
jgi:hypothetical protein